MLGTISTNNGTEDKLSSRKSGATRECARTHTTMDEGSVKSNFIDRDPTARADVLTPLPDLHKRSSGVTGRKTLLYYTGEFWESLEGD